MCDARRPRQIRDIAHLYISSRQDLLPSPSAMILIAGDDRDCLPGFHVANLAAAFAGNGLRVNLFERSTLLPNAGYFMSLPPVSYLPWVEFEGRLEVEFGGVNIDCSTGTCTPTGEDRAGPRIDIIHLPPVYPTQPFQTALRKARRFNDDVTIFFLLKIKETPVRESARLVEHELGPSATFILHLGDAVIPYPGCGESVVDLGRLAGWRLDVGSRVPAITRDPNSPLSREYASLAEALLVKINHFRRITGAQDTPQRRPR